VRAVSLERPPSQNAARFGSAGVGGNDAGDARLFTTTLVVNNSTVIRDRCYKTVHFDGRESGLVELAGLSTQK
jgi:hypothetical protein